MEETIKQIKIKNKHYREFLDNGIIQIITPEMFKEALKNIPKTEFNNINLEEAESVLIALYYTGARPVEILHLKAKDITQNNNQIHIRLAGKFKSSLPRTFVISSRRPYITKLYDYASTLFDETYLFFNFRGAYKRTYKTTKGEIKQRIEYSDKLRYHIKKWFTGVLPDSITTYYLRHSRFSQLSEAGASLQSLRMLKGSKTADSITPYLHMSLAESRKISRIVK